MTVRMLVAGLPEAVTDQDLHDLFQTFGAVTESRVQLDPLSRRSLGYGEFVFDGDADLDAAVGIMDGMCLMGSYLSVAVDDPNRQRPLRLRIGAI